MSYFGVSAYAAAAWDRQTTENYFKCFPKNIKRPATAVLFGTFGNCFPFVKRFVEWAGDKPHLVEIHISNECARRSGRDGKQIAKRLGTGEYDRALKEGNTKTLKLVVKRVEKVMEGLRAIANPYTSNVLISVGLEDNLGQESAARLLAQVKTGAGQVVVVRNPMTRQPRIANEWIEGHGRTYHAGQEIWNFDGIHVGAHGQLEDISYENALKAIRAAYKQFKAVFLWSADAQGWRGSGNSYEGRTYEISETEQEGFKYILREAQK